MARMNTAFEQRLADAYQRVKHDVLSERVNGTHWVGQLSSSALSTATTVSALALVRRHDPTQTGLSPMIENGLRYLIRSVRADGGWGDTDRSYANLATTMLAIAAFHLAGAAPQQTELLRRAERYVAQQRGIAGLRRRYGADKTFAVPILANSALAGLVDWRQVAPLPFELACLPQRWYRWARLPVVSYALPALVAIGHARYVHRPPRWPWMRAIRRLAREPSLKVLKALQPASGGYLEAAPLTAFVVMSLAATGQVKHDVVRQGVRFLLDSVRPDGSVPIDTNLATWNTSLALTSLAAGGEDIAALDGLDWLLDCQHDQRHPFTGAEAGGWGWSDLSGAVPDADDTPGALLALAAWRRAPSCSPAARAQIDRAADPGLRWLLGLQNRDGGWPTFCRGWGKLPFDRSGADLTAHAVRALQAWGDHPAARAAPRAIRRAFAFLARRQRSDGSWLPLWFGNQDEPDESCPVYGTAKVVLAYRDAPRRDQLPATRSVNWLCQAQNPDGGWGGSSAGSSVEETALAVEALLSTTALFETTTRQPGALADTAHPATPIVPAETLERGLNWLLDAVDSDRYQQPSPIGLYFARLWYYERLYPRLFTLAALGRACQHLGVGVARSTAAHRAGAPTEINNHTTT